MASLDLEWIVVFDEVYSALSVTQAAEKLGITQGAASTALGRMRAYFDDPLFTRTSRGMRPTPRADALYPTLRQIRESLDSARGEFQRFDPLTANRRFRLCMTDLGEISLLPKLMNLLRTSAPGIQVEAEKIGPESRRRLEEGNVDLAIGYMPQLDAGFYQQSIVDQDFYCIVSRRHPRITNEMTATQFSDEGHIEVASNGTGHAALIEKSFEAAGLRRRISLHVSSFLAVAQIVSETDLIATVPRHYAKLMVDREPIRYLDPPCELPSYAVKQHWHARFHRDAGNVWLRQAVSLLMPSSVLAPTRSSGKNP